MIIVEFALFSMALILKCLYEQLCNYIGLLSWGLFWYLILERLVCYFIIYFHSLFVLRRTIVWKEEYRLMWKIFVWPRIMVVYITGRSVVKIVRKNIKKIVSRI